TNKKEGLFAVFYKICQTAGGAGIVLQQAGVGGQVEGGGVDLPPPGVQGAEDGPLAHMAGGQGLQSGDRRAGRIAGEGQPLDRRPPDPQPGEAAGPGVDAEQVDVGAGQPAQLETGVDQGQQGLAVGQPAVEIHLVQKAAVLHQGHAGGLARGIYGQDVHSCTPSMVILRLVWSRIWMSTRMGSSWVSRAAKFSLHSAATTAPWSR